MISSLKPSSPSDFGYPSPEVTECPYAFYAALREQAPVYQLPSGEFVISRWEDVVEAARDTDVFSSNLTLFKPELQRAYAEGNDVPDGRYTPWPVVFVDPPEHRIKRSFSLPIVSRERLRKIEPTVRELADELIDTFIGRGEAEFKSEFADLFPGRVILRVVGVPQEDAPMVRAWLEEDTLEIFGGAASKANGNSLHRGAEFGQGRARARDYFKELIQERHEHPRDDFVSDLARAKAEKDDGELDLYYLAGEVTNMYGAGTFSTSLMLAGTLMLLLQHPEELGQLLEDPALLRSAIDESLRFESAVQWNQRYVMQDTILHGVTIPRGSVVLLNWAAANRDPNTFEDPDRFQIDRPRVGKDQLGFGFGAHMCIGAPLARLEIQITIEQLFKRLKNVRLSDRNDFEHIRSVKYRAPATVHVEFDRA